MRKKAVTYHQEAANHRAMIEEAEKVYRLNPKMSGIQARGMRKHCEPLIRDAERLAKDAEEFAKWHRMRAAELQGK